MGQAPVVDFKTVRWLLRFVAVLALVGAGVGLGKVETAATPVHLAAIGATPESDRLEAKQNEALCRKIAGQGDATMIVLPADKQRRVTVEAKSLERGTHPAPAIVSLGGNRRGFEAFGHTKVLFKGLDLRNVTFLGQPLNECRFINCNLEGANFRNASVENACFVNCRFDRNTQFQGARFLNTEFLQCSLTLPASNWPEIVQSVLFRYCRFPAGDYRPLRFNHCAFIGTPLHQMKVGADTFRDCKIFAGTPPPRNWKDGTPIDLKANGNSIWLRE